MRGISLALFCAFLAVVPIPARSADDSPFVINPVISTDKSVDCSSVDRILAGLVHPGMTDEQKVLAVFNWIRRVMYHGDGPEEYAFDFGKMVQVLGNGSCLRQTAPLALLLKRLGYESESWVHDGHHMLQVSYGGKWHCLDPHMNFYVFDRSVPPHIAGLEQLRVDSTLAWAAEAEHRSAPGFLLCGDSPAWFSGGGLWEKEPGWPDVTIKDPLRRLTLRRGESISFSWLPGDYYYRKAWQFDYGPYHTCGARDSLDTANWPIYEPYRAIVNDTPCYRHWAQGKMVYYPDLFSDHFQDGVAGQKNIVRLCPCFVLMPQDLRYPGELVFSVDCPYVITAGEFRVKKGEMHGGITAEVSTDGMKNWQPVTVTDSGQVVRGLFVDQINGSFNGYYLKLILAGDSSMESLEMTSYFQHNPLALPYLVPGENLLKVEAEHFGSQLKLEWSYAEGPDWKNTKTILRNFPEAGELKVAVGGEKYPRNLSLTLSVLP